MLDDQLITSETRRVTDNHTTGGRGWFIHCKHTYIYILKSIYIYFTNYIFKDENKTTHTTQTLDRTIQLETRMFIPIYLGQIVCMFCNSLKKKRISQQHLKKNKYFATF